MALALETLGYLLAALGLVMLAACLPHSQWRVSTVHGSVITTNTIFENLWYSCATDSMGVHNCREFPSLLALSGYLQACRALMITAIVLGCLGLALGSLGLRCTNMGGLAPAVKTRLAVTAGALHLLSGLCGMVTISWYAANVTREFFDPLYNGTKYELGPALYLGWSAALLSLLGGLALCLRCCADQDPEPGSKARAWTSYQLPSKRATSSVVRPAAASDDDLDSSFGKYGKNAYV